MADFESTDSPCEKDPERLSVFPRSRSQGHVLLALGDAECAKRIAGILDPQQHIVTLVEQPAEGLEKARAGSVDVFVVDGAFGKGCGLDICRVFAHDLDLRDVPVLLLSDKEDADAQRQAFDIGAWDCQALTADPRVLVARIQQLMDQRERLLALRAANQVMVDRLRIRSRKLTETSRQLKSVFDDCRRDSQQHKETSRLLEQLIGAVPSILIGLKADGRITHWNRVAEETFGLNAGELLGRRLDACGIPWDGVAVTKNMAACIRSGAAIRMDEMGFIGSSGTMGVLGLTLNPIKSSSGQVCAILIFGTDITKRKTLEDQLLHAQKMEAVGRLAGGVAHDFNNLLMVIMGHADLLAAQLPASDEHARKRVREIRTCATRAASLTHQLLAFSRKQVIQPQVVNVNSLVSDTQKMLGRLIGEDIELDVCLAEGLGAIKADPGQVVQVIMNLAVNARDAMPKGGRLVIKTANIDLERGYADRHDRIEAGSYVMIAVSDTGCGMNEETQARIFEPFFTTKELGKGTGLGLSSVYGMIKQSGGSVLVYSELGLGTTFKVYFPRLVEGKPSALSSARLADATTHRKTVLVAEDEPGVLSLVMDRLRNCGYRAIPALNGREALEKAMKNEGGIDLLVTDIVMPEIGGFELATQMKTRFPDLKVLFMSGHADPRPLGDPVTIGKDPFLQKPFGAGDIERMVKNLLAV